MTCTINNSYNELMNRINAMTTRIEEAPQRIENKVEEINNKVKNFVKKTYHDAKYYIQGLLEKFAGKLHRFFARVKEVAIEAAFQATVYAGNFFGLNVETNDHRTNIMGNMTDCVAAAVSGIPAYIMGVVLNSKLALIATGAAFIVGWAVAAEYIPVLGSFRRNYLGAIRKFFLNIATKLARESHYEVYPVTDFIDGKYVSCIRYFDTAVEECEECTDNVSSDSENYILKNENRIYNILVHDTRNNERGYASVFMNDADASALENRFDVSGNDILNDIILCAGGLAKANSMEHNNLFCEYHGIPSIDSHKFYNFCGMGINPKTGRRMKEEMLEACADQVIRIRSIG